MTEATELAIESAWLRSSGGLRVVRACCLLVALLLVAAIGYGGVMAIENYEQIAV